MRHAHIQFGAALIAVASILSAAAHAATVTWSSPTTIAGDSDVITTGTLVTALNFSQFQLATTVNGVLFSPFAVTNGGNGIFGLPNVVSFGFSNMESSDTAYGSAAAPYNTLSASYQTLLSSGAGSSTGPSLNLSLLGLTNGTQYLFQWWSNDSGLNYGGVNSTTATALNAVVLDENTTNTVGGMGQWVSGTFTASGTSQSITLSGARPVINGFQLRAVPEPSTLVLLGSALFALGCARRRRQS